MTVARVGGWLRFSRGGAGFAVDSVYVLAVVAQPGVARVPATPRVLVGLIAWRGGVLPMLEPDPSGARGARAAPAAIVVSSEGGDLAVAADAIEGWSHVVRADDQVFDPDTSWRGARAALKPGADPIGGSHLER